MMHLYYLHVSYSTVGCIYISDVPNLVIYKSYFPENLKFHSKTKKNLRHILHITMLMATLTLNPDVIQPV